MDTRNSHMGPVSVLDMDSEASGSGCLLQGDGENSSHSILLKLQIITGAEEYHALNSS